MTVEGPPPREDVVPFAPHGHGCAAPHQSSVLGPQPSVKGQGGPPARTRGSSHPRTEGPIKYNFISTGIPGDPVPACQTESPCSSFLSELGESEACSVGHVERGSGPHERPAETPSVGPEETESS